MSATITLSERITTAKDYISRNFDPTNTGNYSYFYTGRTTPWSNENSPMVSSSAQNELFTTLFSRIFMKFIGLTNVSLATKRFNWTTNTVYTRADYNIDYTDARNWIGPENPFFVINSENNVYKCISNKYGGYSTVQPTGQSLGYIQLSDGYTWKFMLDVSTANQLQFFTDLWIPVPYTTDNKTYAQTQVEGAAVVGDIPYINVDNAGIGYSSPPSIVINGDGTGAQAVAIMNGASIQSIEMSHNGSGYTYADVYIFGNGKNASATAMIAPPGGHGSNAVNELGAFFVVVFSEIVSDEGGTIPTTGTYRNIGIVKNTKDNSGSVITTSEFNTISNLSVINSSGNYLPSEYIIGGTSQAKCMVYNDPGSVNKTINVYMVEGTFMDGETLYGQTTGIYSTFVLSGSTFSSINIRSGELLYKENIVFITRKDVQTEEFVFSIEF